MAGVRGFRALTERRQAIPASSSGCQQAGPFACPGDTEPDRGKLTPPEIARLYGVSPDKVLGWIRAGELRAINIATKLGGRPRYLVDRIDLNAFETQRQVIPDPSPNRKRRHRDSNVIEFTDGCGPAGI